MAQIVLFMDEDSTWTSLQINYLINSRDDLSFGSLIVDGYIFQSTSSNPMNIYYNANLGPSDKNKPILMGFSISGLKSYLPQPVNLKYVKMSLDNLGLGQVVLSTSTPFELLYLNFYWLIMGSQDIQIYVNITNGASVGYLFVQVIEVVGSEFTEYLVGLNRTNVSACNGNLCPRSCVANTFCSSQNGIQINNSCFLCGPFQTYSKENCVNNFACSNHQVWNGSACVCSQGYIFVGGFCRPSCGANAYVNSGNCQCISNIGCIPVQTCPLNQILVDNACVCDQGYALISGVCQLVFTCPPGTLWNSATESCVCPSQSQFLKNGVCVDCSANSLWNGTSCICLPGYYLIGSGCGQCGANSAWNGKSCACNSGFVLVDSICTVCPANSSWDPLKGCVCNPGYFMLDRTCVGCSDNSVWNGQSCVCLPGFSLVNSGCTRCPPNTVSNGFACICISGYYKVKDNCELPPPNTYYDSKTSTFQCVAAFVLVNGACTTCPPRSSYNAGSCLCDYGFEKVNGVCQCASGTVWNGLGCVPTCNPNASWNGTACDCNRGYFNIRGVCQTCDPNTIYSSSAQMCTCRPGFYGTYQACNQCDFSCATCSGPGPSSCIACPLGASLTGSRCFINCGAGRISMNGQCLPCPNGCLSCSHPSTCTQCNQGFTILHSIVNNASIIGCTVSGSAKTTGSTIVLKNLVWGERVVYQGVSLGGLPSYFAGNNCQNCGDIFSVLVLPQDIGINYSIQYVLYTQYLFIITFTFPSQLLPPPFSFKVELNFKYSPYFSNIDLFNSVIGNVDPRTYSVGAGLNESVPYRQVVQSGTTVNFSTNTIVSMFSN